MDSDNYRLGIALLGKGSTNHLHRKEVVEEFLEQGVRIRFLVRDDYFDILTKLEGCEYTTVSFTEASGFRATLKFIFEYIRNLYPSTDSCRKSYFGMITKYKRSIGFRLLDVLYNFLARFQYVVSCIACLEGWLGLNETVQGVEAKTIDQLLLLGIGTASSELEGHMVWWAKGYNIPVVNIIGNYDNLTSKGFRGVPVDRLLVWGPSMHNDAIKFHGIPEEKITSIGSIRYNTSFLGEKEERHDFLSSLGLDPEKKTIMFAGFFYEFHYFEMMEIYRQWVEVGKDYQLILRVYPNKFLMSSVFMTPLLDFAKEQEGVYVSIGDPDYSSGSKDKSVLQIEEYELCNSLNTCDCVINIFSTISLEACIFDKPAINMYYFQEPLAALARTPLYYDYEKFFHSRRLVSYGAIRTTRNRAELMKEIDFAIENPKQLAAERKKTVELECGALDGGACKRLVDACIIEYQNRDTKL